MTGFESSVSQRKNYNIGKGLKRHLNDYNTVDWYYFIRTLLELRITWLSIFVPKE